MQNVKFRDGVSVKLDGECVVGYRNYGCCNSWDDETKNTVDKLIKNQIAYSINLFNCYTLYLYLKVKKIGRAHV